jgi:hypothetical protein
MIAQMKAVKIAVKAIRNSENNVILNFCLRANILGTLPGIINTYLLT